MLVPASFAEGFGREPAGLGRVRQKRRFERAIVIVAVGFSLFALWGTGAEAVGWGLVLLAIGHVLRLAMHRMSSTRPSVTIATEL